MPKVRPRLFTIAILKFTLTTLFYLVFVPLNIELLAIKETKQVLDLLIQNYH